MWFSHSLYLSGTIDFFFFCPLFVLFIVLAGLFIDLLYFHCLVVVLISLFPFGSFWFRSIPCPVVTHRRYIFFWSLHFICEMFVFWTLLVFHLIFHQPFLPRVHVYFFNHTVQLSPICVCSPAWQCEEHHSAVWESHRDDGGGGRWRRRPAEALLQQPRGRRHGQVALMLLKLRHHVSGWLICVVEWPNI